MVRFGEGEPDKVVIGGRFTFDETGTDWLRFALPPAIRIPADFPAAHPLRTALTLLEEEVGRNGVGENIVIARLADILLVQALRAHFAVIGEQSPNWLVGLADPLIGRALRAFHAAIGADRRLNSLAAQAGMSRSSFADTFRLRTGLTPMDYVTR